MLEEGHFESISMEYGCPKHFKGLHDACIGHLMGLFSEARKVKRLKKIKDVVEVYMKWAEEDRVLHPGSDYYMDGFMPRDKELYKFIKLTSASVGTCEGQFSWRFDRDKSRKSLRGKDLNMFTFTGITVRNYGVSGVERFEFKGNPEEDVSAEVHREEEEDAGEEPL